MPLRDVLVRTEPRWQEERISSTALNATQAGLVWHALWRPNDKQFENAPKRNELRSRQIFNLLLESQVNHKSKRERKRPKNKSTNGYLNWLVLTRRQ